MIRMVTEIYGNFKNHFDASFPLDEMKERYKPNSFALNSSLEICFDYLQKNIFYQLYIKFIF